MVIGSRVLRLTYDTSRKAPTASGTPTTNYVDLASFGPLWQSSLHRKLSVDSSSLSVQVYRGNGRIVSFGVNGSNYVADADANDRLVSVSGGGYRFFDASEQSLEGYDSAGQLTRIDWTSGQTLQFVYSTASTPAAVAPAPGYLLSVTDTFGRAVQFEYTLPAGAPAATGGLISKITDPAGQSTIPAYDAAGNVTQLTWQDTKTRQFLYENPSFTWALTGVIDERGIRRSTFGYDSAGRAISTEHAGGVNRYSVTYTSPPVAVVNEAYDSSASILYRYHEWQLPVDAVLSDPRGANIALGVTSVLGVPRVTSRSQPAGSGCAASTNNMGYDANGNVELEDDFNGSRICRAHDLGRNLEVTRVEGLANTQACTGVISGGSILPSGSRKVSSQWHPDWRLQSKLAEPKKLTTRVYNGQPDPFNGNAIASCAPSSALLPDGKPIVVLCKQVEQAGTDANGSQGFSASVDASVPARSSNYTYNSYGQVLSATDPLNHSTTYAYYADTTADHTLGDLQSVTNAAGHVSTFDRYNAHGQVLQSTDANGVVTTYSYDLRQRPTSVTVAGQTTSYGYDNAGQLTQVTLPDQTVMTYTYDAAHRLTGIADAAGNTVTYTLDNAGNRTGEQTKDPSGALARNISRAFDALNRVQSVTGAAQ